MTGFSSIMPPYWVGKTGPAGGYIFYDKGEYSDGWRYLEAAPADLRVVDGVPTVDSSCEGYGSVRKGYEFGCYVSDGKNGLLGLVHQLGPARQIPRTM